MRRCPSVPQTFLKQQARELHDDLQRRFRECGLGLPGLCNERALPQCCHDRGRFGGTHGDGRALPPGWNVTDTDLLPEVLRHHHLSKSCVSGSGA